jgi:pimeloyl-ACP methyl ester carboxylesterase
MALCRLMPKASPPIRRPVDDAPSRVRRGYFECRYGQLHVHYAMPPGGGFEEGTPLLCVHDVSGSAWVFARFLALAGRDRSVYAPDLPGFGESDPPAARPTVSDYALALGDFLDNMRLRHIDVFGYRAGAIFATELALARPSQIGRVVMVSAPLLTDPERQAATRAVPPAAADPGARPPELQRWGADAAAEYPLRQRLAKLTQRLLVLRPRDELWEATARVREVLPAARVTDLELSGTALLGASAQRAADAVREFLRA